MRVSDVDVVIVPGFGGSEEEHWISRWEAKLSTARRMVVSDWEKADRSLWVEAIVATAAAATRPVVVVAHSLGVIATVHAAPRLAGTVIGAYLVGPSDWEQSPAIAGIAHDFAPIPMKPLPFPSVVVASRNDPFCSYERAETFAHVWGATLVDAGESGHINVDSGHGPWPEGLMRFAGFLKSLGPAT